MDKVEAAEKIAALKVAMGLTALSEKLECTKSHTIDLCKGRRGVSRPIAEKLEVMTGRAWHEWLPPIASTETEQAAA